MASGAVGPAANCLRCALPVDAPLSAVYQGGRKRRTTAYPGSLIRSVPETSVPPGDFRPPVPSAVGDGITRQQSRNWSRGEAFRTMRRASGTVADPSLVLVSPFPSLAHGMRWRRQW